MERLVDVDTPLGSALWFRQMTGTEALSNLFEFDITFHSKQSGLSAKAMLGNPITMKVETEGGGVRHFNGICTRFASSGREGEHLLYVAKVRPWLWLASRRTDCRIFQHLSAPEIIQQVLDLYGHPVRKKLVKTYRKWEYCVQYQESDMHFVMRMMEHEGIYFYFEHSSANHTLVMADDMNASHSALPGRSTIKYYGVDAAGVVGEEHFNSWLIREEVDSGHYFTDDYDFEKPSTDLSTARQRPMGHAHDAYEVYEWPGGYTQHPDGEFYADARMDMLVAEHERAVGYTTLRTMAPGYRFTLTNCPRKDQNREYLAVAATYFFRNNARLSSGSGDGDADWGITVTSQPTTIAYRPQILTPKPRTHGPQTAVVVGPKGEEIYTDKYGRVKVQFHWDRLGKKDENSSCWLRVSSPWAGSNYGGIHIPRIGQEVIVDFIGGDPDYPIITGRVYNAEQMPPWELPANKTQSGFLTRSTKGGTPGHGMRDSPGTANAIRFEDKIGEEQLWLHAQKDQLTEVEHDEDKWVGNDRRKVIDRDEFNTIHRDRTEIVDRNEKINVHGWRTEEVDLDETITIHKNRKERVDLNEKIDIGVNQSITIGSNRDKTVGNNEKDKIGRNWSVNVGRFKTQTIGMAYVQTVGVAKIFTAGVGYVQNVGVFMQTNVGMNQNLLVGRDREVKVGGKQSTSVGGERTSHVAADDKLTVGGELFVHAKKIHMEADQEIVLTCGSSTIKITGTDIQILSPLDRLNC